jgi:hypothetical protein
VPLLLLLLLLLLLQSWACRTVRHDIMQCISSLSAPSSGLVSYRPLVE